MGLLDEVKAASHPPRRNKLDEIREKLSQQDFDEFMLAIVDVRVTQASLVHALQKRGIHIGKGTICDMRRDLMKAKV